jgi:glyoxylase I family protein
MSIQSLDHINLRAPPELLEELRRFYESALGLAVGHRPPFGSHGYWLYAGASPLVHLQALDATDTRATQVATTLDHVAFAAAGFGEVTRRLEALGVAFTTRSIPLTGARQVFLRDPAGNGVELLFPHVD